MKTNWLSNRWSTHFRFTSVAVFDWTDHVDIKFLSKDWICFSEFLVAFSVSLLNSISISHFMMFLKHSLIMEKRPKTFKIRVRSIYYLILAQIDQLYQSMNHQVRAFLFCRKLDWFLDDGLCDNGKEPLKNSWNGL